jgi:hypothetical protein
MKVERMMVVLSLLQLLERVELILPISFLLEYIQQLGFIAQERDEVVKEVVEDIGFIELTKGLNGQGEFPKAKREPRLDAVNRDHGNDADHIFLNVRLVPMEEMLDDEVD